MTKSEAVKLLRAFETLYERAYRRGFHHGTLASPTLSSKQLHAWRFAELGRSTVPPPGNHPYRCPIKERIEMECHYEAERKAITDLLKDAGESNPT